MKLLIDARSLGSHPSGIGIYLYDFLKELIKQEVFEVTLLSDVALSSEMQWLAQQNVPIITYGKQIAQSAGVFQYFKFIQDSLDYYQPDLFWEPNNLIPVPLRRFTGKIMVTIHDIFPISQPEHHGFLYPKYFRYGMKQTLKQADLITYNSIETKCETENRFPQAKDIPHMVSYIIVNKPDLSDAPVTPDILFSKVKVDGEDFFLYIGNLEKRKGTDLLLKAYEAYRALGGEKKLYLGGRIREPEIQQLFDRMQEKVPGIVSLGYVGNEEKNALFRYCSGFLFPSRAEGFGIPVVEAMHFNKPILASNLSIFHEIVGDAISYFDCSGTEEEQIQKLAEAMLQLKSADLEAYATVTRRYLPEQLGKEFCDYIKKECSAS
ncbi:MAG: glycosyltransferase family 4 protein [Bacteroides sp.]|nr:glycosyltransferase family 4 protein [Bacteroides sp.]MCM1550790.1 glycosyltransferase family 4 protein [Clostridium sp.]